MKAKIIALMLLAAWPAASGTIDPARLPVPIDLSSEVHSLIGTPTTLVISSASGTKKTKLIEEYSQISRLVINRVKGEYFWASRNNMRLVSLPLRSATVFVCPGLPGNYIKFTRINGKITYIEHIVEDFETMTYWGEMQLIYRK